MSLIDFFDQRHAASRLESSVVMYKKKPIYILSVEGANRGKYRINYMEVGDSNSRIKYVFYPNEGFDFTPVTLGYIQLPKSGVLPAYRVPSRQWKLGLHADNLHTQPAVALSSSRVSHNTLLKSVSLKKCIENQFCSFSDAMKRVSKHAYGTAFSRDYAITSKGLLYHRLCGEVGQCEMDKPSLNEDFSFLKETLEEALA